MELTSITGPNKEPVSKPRTEDQHVHAVEQITDRKESDTPNSSEPSVSLIVRDHPLQLVLRVVKEKLNDALPSHNKRDVFKGAADLELSPELTARYIVAHATSLYEPYKLRQGKKSAAIIFQDFMDRLTRSLEQGFDEARNMLLNLGVLQGEIERDVNKTVVLTQKNLHDFRTAMQL